MSQSSEPVLDRITESGVVAIVRGIDADDAVDAVSALAAGGVRAIEITADTDGVLGMLRAVDDAVGDGVSIGVGTVLDAETARAAMLAGAEFVITPSFDPAVVEVCNRYGKLVAPGVFTPTEAANAYAAGADLVKVFPASSGGPAHVRALGGPLGHVPTMPTGGVGLENVAAYVDAGAVAVGVGSSLVDREAIAAGDFDRLTETAERFRARIDEARPDRNY
ncbi:bifunctional 4-hydroxy-2-oxoglutarate aldolase/2-dehydro-3-deoxy-phosphogluconate aldolase [Halegenticoccus tardaugens]|uniref:bifunctional 4-hydroxy-2-oxoglutarate aldolase/2-dehydro-3-deoxy-phosphogluconate aldolase n=1 Tax=Halegenticoccus tardaugens TaxID=2071624 RepID=UPI00100B73A9|nr:bifunctional 4-hydroxy-2-oxoglutarate aldolase/2-dehydro-3-deoxy-phosphogluconate aldolase [Halegenticoccus tardaugens]